MIDQEPRDRPRWLLFLGGALLIHAALMVSSLRRSREARPALARVTAREEELEIDAAPTTAAEPAPTSTGDPPQTPAPPRAVALPRPTPPGTAPTRSLEPNNGAAENTAPEPESSPREPSKSSPLSLAELGVGATNPFVARQPGEAPPEPERRSPREVGRERFQRALATQIALADQAVGVGPEGPVLGAVERAARDDNPEPSSQALFDFFTDASGKVVRVALVSSSSDPAPWRRIGDATLRALARTPLKLPRAGYSATLRIRVISHIEMPSGADPGLAVSALGIPLKKGRGPRSARIDILNIAPELTADEETLPSGQTVRIPKLRLGNLLSIMGDPSDIGAKPARMVRAHLERLTLNEKAP